MTLTRAADYQRQTMYSRHSTGGGGMDWANKPEPYLYYPGAEMVSLPRELVLPKVEGVKVLQGGLARIPQPLDLTALSALLFMAYGFTDQVDYGTEIFLYRSAPSAGALYPVDVYLSAQGIEGLEDGLYYYSLTDFGLARLRSGPPPAGVPAPALILSARYFRSSWKYKDRAFRYCLLDAGHVAENIALALPTLGLSGEFFAQFDDKVLNAYLGLEPEKAAVLGFVSLAGGEDAVRVEGSFPEDPAPAPQPVAPKETAFEAILEVAGLTAAPLSGEVPEPDSWPEEGVAKLPKADWTEFEGPTFISTLRKRRSRRNFRPETLKGGEMSRFLDLVLTPDVGRLINVGVITNEIQDVTDGFYWTRPGFSGVRLHKGGFLGPNLANAALGQDWVGRGGLILLVTAPLDRLEDQIGPRALRLAYLAAGRLGQRAYLAAEAMGWGCCGVGAFYDGEVSALLDLDPGEPPVYILPVGPVKKRTHGGRPTPR